MFRERLKTAADEYMASKAAQFGPEQMRSIEKQVLFADPSTRNGATIF